MQQRTAEGNIALTAKAQSQASSAFPGFRPPTSNTTYTPNQFFDVVIPNFSRGVVRIVGFLIRKSLGWCDANGNPQEEQIELCYNELERQAGVSRDMIRLALDNAKAGHLVECVREGRPKVEQDAGQSALYSLKWSDAPYTTRPTEFRGFFEGDGNRTDIPNEFFDVVVPHEPLSVIKVVGSIIRHSIGFQTKHGRRRQQVALTFRHIQNYAQIGSRSDLANAVRIALEKNYIIRVIDGVFSHRDDERRSATYALRWSDFPNGQKSGPALEWSENQTSNGQKSGPAERSEKRTSIETKLGNETVKQQPKAPNDLGLAKLVAEGFDNDSAAQLADQHSLGEIEQQIAWLPLRMPFRSKLGMLRRAIEGNWPEPSKVQAPELLYPRGWEFARHFLAAFGGNNGEPAAEPSHNDAEIAQTFVERLLKVSPDPDCVPAWGRELASLALAQRSPLPSLALAIRQGGDALLARIESRARTARVDALRKAQAEHYAQYLPLYQLWLKAQESEIRRSNPDEFRSFEERRRTERERLSSSQASWSRSMLLTFDQDSSRLEGLRTHFHLPEFWQWDPEFNSEPFKPKK